MSRIILIIATVFMASVAHTATLEIPGPGSTQSGIGLISGWKCRASGRLTIRFDGGSAVPLVYGSERGDTRRPKGPCDNANNGFVAVMNWGNLGDGTHTAVVYDNGVEFDRATFRVVTPGVAFLRGATGSGIATLNNGQRATLKWSEASQGFVVTAFTNPGDGTTPPPVARGVGQFIGTWRFTNSITTQTYRFPRMEACRGNTSEQCLYDDSQGAAIGEGRVDGHDYALFHQDGSVCRLYVLHEPTGATVRGHYGYGFGSCTSDSVTESIATDIVLKRYPTTGRRISQSASQTFSLEVEEEMEEEVEGVVTQEDIEDAEIAIEEMLFLMAE